MAVVIKSDKVCTDLTLPARNPLWTPPLLGSALKLHLDGQLGKTVDGTNELTTWTDQAQGLAFTQSAGDGAMNTYNFNGVTVPRFTLDGYKCGTTSVDTVAGWRGFWMVIDQIDTSSTQQNFLFDATLNKLQVYRTSGGNWQINGLASTGVFTPGAFPTGKQIAVCWPSAAGTYKFHLNGAQLGSNYSASTVQNTMGPLAIGRYDPGAIDTAFASVGVTTGVLALADVQKLEGYLAHRYGLTASLPSGHPYKTTAPRKRS